MYINENQLIGVEMHQAIYLSPQSTLKIIRLDVLHFYIQVLKTYHITVDETSVKIKRR